VFGNYYGTPARHPLSRTFERKAANVLFDIDWQGTQQLAEKKWRDDLVSVFIPAAIMGASWKGRLFYPARRMIRPEN